MKLSVATAILSFLSAFATATADTSPEPDSGELFKKDCPSLIEGYYLGKCNGLSCKWHGVNLDCEKGKCVGKGGGDGSCCHVKGSVHCPNGGWIG
ncbi:unnamed protein product [Clonostachys rosea]|uniref:Invertebrate defensins family profile domain-containing protein n=1 Tax=Bionectria ochroleuca TaxID=29856 RepID=A0ABY6UU45_BIOOC|nr:unnamed protein product [Clonostachys rosea]